MWVSGQGGTEVHCGLELDFPGLIHTWLPTCTCIWTLDRPWYVELIWSYLNLNWASRVGFGVSGLAMGGLHRLHCECWCALGSDYRPVGVLIDNWCMPVVLGLLMGRDCFWCPLSFFGVGGAAFLRLAWVLWSYPGMYLM